jgi:hypothetical protein
MVHLDLSAREAETLATVLEGELSDLSWEIAQAEGADVRLEQRREILNKVLDVLVEEETSCP